VVQGYYINSFILKHKKVKTLQCLLVALSIWSTFAEAQDAKRQLRDFTPKYTIDTFLLTGEPASMKRRVIEMLQVKGIRSAFWDDGSNIATVQYDSKLLKLSFIKILFTMNDKIPEQIKVKEEGNNALVIYNIVQNIYPK
jgi:hypothetical protein